jgi:MFS family permease
MLAISINILVPLLAGLVYFLMAAEIRRVTAVRKLIFGEVGYKKVFIAFLLFGIYFVTRPLQNILGPHPWPMIVNSARQFFLMAIISPAVLVGILHWVPNEKGTPRSATVAAYAVGVLMASIFILINVVAITGSKVLGTIGGVNIYDAVWFPSGSARIELVLIHLISQMISPVGFFLLSAAYVRHRRYNYSLSSVYNLMTLKWKYLETGLLIFALSLLFAGFAAFFGQYYTYLWVIYFVGAIIAGMLELKSVKLPPREAPADLRDA